MNEAAIKDSGNRTEFETGAVRDIQIGKGRCDLLPLNAVSDMFDNEQVSDVFDAIDLFLITHDYEFLRDALDAFVRFSNQDVCTMLLETSVHFEQGAIKYGENNWQKGLPVKSYINSALRHFIKHLRGDHDERHDRAFCWNILCAIWTCKNFPEMMSADFNY